MKGRSVYRETGHVIYHVGAILTMVAWGVSFVSSKVLLDNGLQPAEVYVYRTLLAYILILFVSHKRLFANNLVDELLFVACGLCAGSLYFIAENTALEYTLVSNVSLIVTLAPLLTTLLVGAIYKNERPGRNVLIGSLVAFVGVGCVIFNSSFEVNVKPLGDLLALGAAMSWAVYSIVLRKLNVVYGVMFISRKTFFYGMLTAIPFLVFQPAHTPLTVFLKPEVALNFLFLGVFCSMLAFVVWAWVNKGLGAVTASNYLYFQPVVTLIASALLLGEALSIVGIIGCVLILLGVWFSDKYGQNTKTGS